MNAPADPSNQWKDVTENLNRINPTWHPTFVHDRLWLGGTPDHDLVVAPGTLTSPWAPSVQAHEFDSCLTATPVAGPAGTGVAEYRCTFPDTSKPYTFPTRNILDAATWAATRWNEGDRLLVRCRAGLNRSGLLAALTLVLVNPQLTWADAAAQLRAQRHPDVLVNPQLYRLGEELTITLRGADA